MKILKVLGEEETTAAIKLAAVNAFVATVRSKYGNGDVEVTAGKVPSVDGMVPISLLNDSEKVAVATNEIKQAVSMATAICEGTEGALFDRVIEGFVAVNSILCNLDAESDSAY